MKTKTGNETIKTVTRRVWGKRMDMKTEIGTKITMKTGPGRQRYGNDENE